MKINKYICKVCNKYSAASFPTEYVNYPCGGEITQINKVIKGDCLEVMKDIPDKSIDMILCDLPI